MEYAPTRQERRDTRQRKQKARMQQSGKSLLRVYRDAVLKRAQGLSPAV